MDADNFSKARPYSMAILSGTQDKGARPADSHVYRSCNGRARGRGGWGIHLGLDSARDQVVNKYGVEAGNFFESAFILGLDLYDKTVGKRKG